MENELAVLNPAVVGAVAHVACCIGGAAAVVKFPTGRQCAVGRCVGAVAVVVAATQEHGVRSRVLLWRRRG